MSKSFIDLWKKGKLIQGYWFIEAIVVIVVWTMVILLDKENKMSILSWHASIWQKFSPDKNEHQILQRIQWFYLAFVILAIAVNIWKRFRICSSVKCYLGMEDKEKFQKEVRMMNIATLISVTGIAGAMPAIYVLSLAFKIIFVSFLEREEKKNKPVIEELKKRKKN